MNVHIAEDVERLIRSHLQSSRFVPEGEVIEATLRRPGERPSAVPAHVLTEKEFQRQLVDLSLISGVPDLAADHDEPEDEPIIVEGEPLSETVVRERR